jgi:hypothetical protein
VQEELQYARLASECVTLKFVLSRHVVALERLIWDLKDRAFEARHETHPSAEAGQHFREVFDAAIHQFWRAVDRPDQSDSNSCRRSVYDLTTAFSDTLFELLPGIGRSKVLATARSPSVTYDWRCQLDDAANAADILAQTLQGVLASLESELSKKHLLYRDIGDAVQRLLKVL